ncbi:MAG TPA: hypothetical protein VIK97_17400 [Casimicrobiaceae bacterium]
MAIRKARDQLGRILSQRCFYLFLLLLVLIGNLSLERSHKHG